MYRTSVLSFAIFVLTAGVSAAEVAPFSYLGREVCTECHLQQASLWAGSHHDKAMQVANKSTVLGDFDDVSLTQFGVTTTFYQEDDRYIVKTEGPDGKLRDYKIKYTFGVDPLQQYLIEFPGGRLQALSLAWDTRAKHEGGQRWFHLYPDERISHEDELHWTRPSQNWNSRCAECHSTNLRKNYDARTKTFATTWSEIDVSCEACHGPGSEHVAWARKVPGSEKRVVGRGFAIRLDERRDVHWTIDPGTGNATRSEVRRTDKEIEMCARCHSRRTAISTRYAHGEPLLDHYVPRLLDQGMYHVDGQINDEVYVYGSFVQSKMYQAGVTCSDCHEPHSLKLRVAGNGVCLNCHLAAKYDQAGHHFHRPGSEGASCAECHMPPKTYMVVDPRHDHSMRIPRPHLSIELGTPNACNNCHKDKTADWAARHIETQYGGEPTGFSSYAEALAAGRSGEPGAGEALAEIVRSPQSPNIVRATALAELGPYLSADTADVLSSGLADDNPGLRVSALRALEFAPAALRVRLAFPALSDPARGVRIEAARVLASIPAGQLPAHRRLVLARARQEFVTAQQVSAERPEAQINLGNFYAAQGDTTKAIAAYRLAIEISPNFAAAYVNLADLHRAQGNEAEAQQVLQRGTQRLPGNADLHHALGLSLVRMKRLRQALDELRRAATLAPGIARYVYVYAVALNSIGSASEAIAVLEGAHGKHPNNTEILSALATFHRDLGNQGKARDYANKLRAASP
ncbi:MAG: tetratricopeptide repeat protein [Kiloniellales bacterium]|nr:tetratricopeptide repeat protein [Kiloniellales bacterium]